MKPTTITHDELLERKADLARKRLMETVDELEARKHEIEHEATSIVPIAVGALGSFFLMAIAGKRVRRWNMRRRRRAQWRRFSRALRLR
jgi:hypothetical protein